MHHVAQKSTSEAGSERGRLKTAPARGLPKTEGTESRTSAYHVVGGMAPRIPIREPWRVLRKNREYLGFIGYRITISASQASNLKKRRGPPGCSGDLVSRVVTGLIGASCMGFWAY